MASEFSEWHSSFLSDTLGTGIYSRKSLKRYLSFPLYIINSVDDFRALIWNDWYCAWYWNCILYNILKSKDTLVFSLTKFWIYLHGRLYSSFVPSDILKVVDYNWVYLLSFWHSESFWYSEYNEIRAVFILTILMQ